MILYATADIHGSQYRLNTVLEMVEKHIPDIVIICGDITQFGPADVAKNFLDQIPGTVFAVPGNIDTTDAIRGMQQSHAFNLHLKRNEHNGLVFVGITGVDPKETQLLLQEQTYKGMIKDVDVLVSHVPPYGFQDKVFLGHHSGSKELLSILKTYSPRLVLCGHIHEDPGFSHYENTLVVNCSMGKRGNGALITIKERILVEML